MSFFCRICFIVLRLFCIQRPRSLLVIVILIEVDLALGSLWRHGARRRGLFRLWRSGGCLVLWLDGSLLLRSDRLWCATVGRCRRLRRGSIGTLRLSWGLGGSTIAAIAVAARVMDLIVAVTIVAAAVTVALTWTLRWRSRGSCRIRRRCGWMGLSHCGVTSGRLPDLIGSSLVLRRVLCRRT